MRQTLAWFLLSFMCANETQAGEVWLCTPQLPGLKNATPGRVRVDGDSFSYQCLTCAGIDLARVIENNDDYLIAYRFLPNTKDVNLFGNGYSTYTFLDRRSGTMIEFDDIWAHNVQYLGAHTDVTPGVLRQSCVRKE